jgi:hypothetical protein
VTWRLSLPRVDREPQRLEEPTSVSGAWCGKWKYTVAWLSKTRHRLLPRRPTSAWPDDLRRSQARAQCACVPDHGVAPHPTRRPPA